LNRWLVRRLEREDEELVESRGTEVVERVEYPGLDLSHLCVR
jgi:hypothetical protein